MTSLLDPAAMRAAVVQHGVEQTWAGPFDDVCRRLAEVARVDVALGRLVEGHADAVRILEQAGASPQPGAYGVWASRSVGTGLKATRGDDGWCLEGELRFASGVDVVDRVLVPGWADESTHLLFDVPVDAFEADRDSWHTTAMAASRSFTVHAAGVAAGSPVGPQNFYLSRPGFVVGGLGVAAVWVGGAFSVVSQVATGLARFTPTAHQLRRLGVMRQASWQASTLVHALAAEVSSATASEIASARTAAVTACETVVDEAGRIVGPGGLSTDERLARTLADLAIYVRQHHLDLTLEALGRETLGSP